MKLFISHASEDKATFVRALAHGLRNRRLEVWYDEFVLRPGESLRESIEKGLATCDYGVVVLSEAFFEKRWPQQELNGLFGRDLASSKRFLVPIWHEISAERVRFYAPMLADRVALPSSLGVPEIARRIISLVVGDEETQRWEGAKVARHTYAHRYYNPPDDVPRLGYQLPAAGFLEMVQGLRPREVLMAYARPYGTHASAAHVTDEERMLEIERDWHIAPDYFAVDVKKLLSGFDAPLPDRELRELLGTNPS
jgi:TIR domain